MPEQVLLDVGIWIAGVSYAGVSNSVALEGEADVPDRQGVQGRVDERRAEGGSAVDVALD